MNQAIEVESPEPHLRYSDTVCAERKNSLCSIQVQIVDLADEGSGRKEMIVFVRLVQGVELKSGPYLVLNKK